MQRDMELVRKILLTLETEGSGPPRNTQIEVDGYDSTTIGHHVHLMKQAGLVRAADSSAHGRAATAIPFDLTWDGHDYLNHRYRVDAPHGHQQFRLLGELDLIRIGGQVG